MTFCFLCSGYGIREAISKLASFTVKRSFRHPTSIWPAKVPKTSPNNTPGPTPTTLTKIQAPSSFATDKGKGVAIEGVDTEVVESINL